MLSSPPARREQEGGVMMTVKRLLAQRRNREINPKLEQHPDISYDPFLVRWTQHKEEASRAHGDSSPFYFPELSEVTVQRAGAALGIPSEAADLAVIRLYVYSLLSRDGEAGWRKTRSLRQSQSIIAKSSPLTWQLSGQLIQALLTDYYAQRPDALTFVDTPAEDPTYH